MDKGEPKMNGVDGVIWPEETLPPPPQKMNGDKVEGDGSSEEALSPPPQKMDGASEEALELPPPKTNGVNIEGSGENEEALSPPPPQTPSMNGVSRIRVESDGSNEKALSPASPVPGDVVQLLTNHVKVNLTNIDGHFSHYRVTLFDKDKVLVKDKGIIRKVLDQVHDTYGAELEGKDFVYDGESSLFTFGAIPNNKLEFPVVLNDTSSSDSVCGSKEYKMEINFAAKIPLLAIPAAIHGLELKNSQEVLRVLNVILRQHAEKKGSQLLLRQSFFRNDMRKLFDVGDGVLGCRGFYTSFRQTPCGLSLNIDVSTTTIIKSGPVVQFLIDHQNVKDRLSIDWDKAKKVLKNLRIKILNTKTEYKITGLSVKTCKEQTFCFKQKSKNEENCKQQITEIMTVYDYFVHHRNTPLFYSAELPCIDVGKPAEPKYYPLELCSLLPLQRYTKALTKQQRVSLVKKSRQEPKEKLRMLAHALIRNNYAEDPLLHDSGISVSNTFTQVEGRVLSAPQLKVGDKEVFPCKGRWNFNEKKLVDPKKMEVWAVVNFSAHCNIPGLVKDLIICGEMKGINISWPFDVFEESPQHKHAPPLVRVEKMFESITQSELPGDLQFLLCVLPERKNSLLYGPLKRKSLSEHGIVTQCIAPTSIDDQYLTNVLLKINAKLGGLNSKLSVEHSPAIPIVSETPTMILGMHVSHGSNNVPSIAAVVNSRQWPLISKYRASVRTQSQKVEMIESLFKKVSDSKDDGIMRELLMDFYESSGNRKPDQIIIFRNGVSESQFYQVLNVELNQIIEACKFLDGKWNPKFVVIIAQKNHHTKFFRPVLLDNVLPGTVIDDNRICHPMNYDINMCAQVGKIVSNSHSHPMNYNFNLCAQAGKIGTTRPTNYHVLLDQVGFSKDDLQEFVHSLSYVSQRSTSAISVVAPIHYARLAATQMSRLSKSDDTSKFSGGGVTDAAGPVRVPQLPCLNEKVAHSMFFV